MKHTWTWWAGRQTCSKEEESVSVGQSAHEAFFLLPFAGSNRERKGIRAAYIEDGTEIRKHNARKKLVSMNMYWDDIRIPQNKVTKRIS
jgi:hypothetical protein